MEEIKKEPITALLIFFNLLVFMITEITGSSLDTAHMVKCGASFAPYIVEEGQIYRIFTCMFLHFGMTHLANNMVVLFVLGQRLEPVLGKIRFLLVYFLGGIGGNIISLYLEIKRRDLTVSAGASGAVFALMGGMIYVLIRHKGRVKDLTARKIMIMVFFSLYFGFTSSGVDNAAHIGGLICGFLVTAVVYHPRMILNSEP
ncbi:MAG: rhomboid family intramembrane serine protease [Blautia sp.]|nr:rhomboid family intramembrane serine protease [Blautia sp.]